MTTNYNVDWIPPPGATVAELLLRDSDGSRARTIKEALGSEACRRLLEGTLPVDRKIAAILAEDIGGSIEFWLSRERLYQDAVHQRQLEDALLRELPMSELINRQFIDDVNSHAERIASVVRFFGEEDIKRCIDRIDQLPETVKQKASEKLTSRAASLAAWIRAGEILASTTECAPWDPEKLRLRLPLLRALTRSRDPRRFLPKVKAISQECGVAFVGLRPFDGCRARGAVKFISPTKAMLLVSFRHLSDDQFWFSFFHEIGHLLRSPMAEVVDDDWDFASSLDERDADTFASELLIPPQHESDLVRLREAREIIRFARTIGVSMGVVVGQMQHRRIADFSWHNNLKSIYEWDSDNNLMLRGSHR